MRHVPSAALSMVCNYLTRPLAVGPKVGQDTGAEPFAGVETLTGSAAQGKSWMFTIQCEGLTEEAQIMYGVGKLDMIKEQWCKDANVVRAQLERAPSTGKVHVQGCVKFEVNWRRPKLMSALNCNFWCERPRNVEKAMLYCNKDVSYVEFADGEIVTRLSYGDVVPSKQGARTDIELMVEFTRGLASGEKMVTDDDIKRELIARFPDQYLKFGQRIEEVIRLSRPVVEHAPPPKWHKWQTAALDVLGRPPDDRSILFIVDHAGGAGKSTLTRWLLSRGKSISLQGTVANMAHIMSQNKHVEIVIFDMQRSVAENYTHLFAFAEAMKNSVLINTKYHTSVTLLQRVHVVFFVNELPPGVREPDEKGKYLLSQDRPVVWNVYKDGFEVITSTPADVHAGMKRKMSMSVPGFESVTRRLEERHPGVFKSFKLSQELAPKPGFVRGPAQPGDLAEDVRCARCAHVRPPHPPRARPRRLQHQRVDFWQREHGGRFGSRRLRPHGWRR